MLKKLLMLLFVLTLVTACGSTNDGEDYETVESQADANSLNEDLVEVTESVYFGLDQYNLSSEAKAILDIQAEWIKSDDSITVIIEGRCDERGTREYNLALGERRANAVKQYLIKKGILSNRIKTVSYGKEKPVVLGTGESVWAKNRVATTVQEVQK